MVAAVPVCKTFDIINPSLLNILCFKIYPLPTAADEELSPACACQCTPKLS